MLIDAIAERRADARFVVRTGAPRWLFDSAGAAIDVQSSDVDTGVAQRDSLHIDEEETVRRAADFHADFERRADAEAVTLRKTGATLVMGDIPPLAFAAAARADIPAVAIANFTWDWIYSGYPRFDALAPTVIPQIRSAYAAATRALRLPLHGGFEPMEAVTIDIPFIARRSTRDPAETRRALGLPDDRPVVLASFGGYGLDLPLEAISRANGLTVIAAGRQLPGGLRYQDLVAAADVVVSKPGYGIVSECVANNTALLYTSRGRFVEYDLFVAQMPLLLRCRYIDQDDVLNGRWREAIDRLLEQPDPPTRPRVDGAAVAAEHVLSVGGANVVSPPSAARNP